MQIPLITEIQRFSLQDGPGIRTTIFLKGCPLRCPWCHNPETQHPWQELYYYQERCSACGKCVETCPAQACSLQKDAKGHPRINLDRGKCQRCMQCVAFCPRQCRAISGQSIAVDDILREALSDQLFYANSGGGVTISGGDPLLYPEFTLELARRLKSESVHVALETSCFPKNWSAIEPLLEFVDLFIVDLKSLDAEAHERVIHWPLAPILRNIENLFRGGARVRIHIPFIPGFNDRDEDFSRYIEYIESNVNMICGVDILNYHCHGEGKYTFLGRADTYAYKGVEEKPSAKIPWFAKTIKAAGVPSVTVGGLVGVTGCRVGRNAQAGMQPIRRFEQIPINGGNQCQ